MEESVSVNYIYIIIIRIMGSSYHTLIMTEYPEKSIGKPNPPLTPGSESDPELRHWGGPSAVNGEKDNTQPKTKMNDNIGKWTIETAKTKGTFLTLQRAVTVSAKVQAATSPGPAFHRNLKQHNCVLGSSGPYHHNSTLYNRFYSSPRVTPRAK